ncbi:hypothetical protein, partial [Burkholderia sp. LMG 13014]|uniref:hypothetical protein n=1 Tax=Burkholderia sp. LMG 13014 TaxID=2709306 RepID=UPI0019648186
EDVIALRRDGVAQRGHAGRQLSPDEPAVDRLGQPPRSGDAGATRAASAHAPKRAASSYRSRN